MSTWTFDNSHSLVGFSAKHMMISTVRGSFEDFAGTIEYDEANPAAATVVVSIKTATRRPPTGSSATITCARRTSSTPRRGPEMTFRSTSVEPKGTDRALIHGDLTIKDVTRPVTLDAEIVGSANGFDGKRNVAFEARTKIDREQWGLTWNMGLETGGVLVGKQITIELDVRAVEQAPAREATDGDR